MLNPKNRHFKKSIDPPPPVSRHTYRDIPAPPANESGSFSIHRPAAANHDGSFKKEKDPFDASLDGGAATSMAGSGKHG